MLVLESNVVMTTADGYELRSERATIDLGQGTAQGALPVEGDGPAGRIEAQGFHVSHNDGKIRFHGRVHLVVLPGAEL